MPLSLSDFDAVTFDVYGTLIDWEPAIIEPPACRVGRSYKR
jgi:FMN phosphatase YigB (HAD superfamily)